MKTFFPRLVLAAFVLVAAWKFGRSALASDSPENMSLPASCTLMAMSPAERAAHLKRLEMLRRAAGAVKMVTDGFSFQVNLTMMPIEDLQRWAENEQKCCSYLKIENRIAADKKHAHVRVVCPDDLRNETIQSFGLR